MNKQNQAEIFITDKAFTILNSLPEKTFIDFPYMEIDVKALRIDDKEPIHIYIRSKEECDG